MKTLIVDDERLARQELKRLLAHHPMLRVVAEAANGPTAVEAINRHLPELVFLDIQMPGFNGFEVLKRLSHTPHIIFTTAYDQFAIRAFEVNALDYLLKPIEADRLADALRRCLQEEGEASEPDEHPSQRLGVDDHVFVKDGDRCWFVPLAQVALFESEGNYTRLYFHDERPLIYRSLSYLEERLDPNHFFRASRKHLINLAHVGSLEPAQHGGLLVQLPAGPTVEMSRRQAQKFRDRLSL